jgi:hypothetical protein
LPDAAAAFVFSIGVSWLQPNSPTTATDPTTKNQLLLNFFIATSPAYNSTLTVAGCSKRLSARPQPMEAPEA